MRNLLCSTAVMLVASLAFAAKPAEKVPATATDLKKGQKEGQQVSTNPHVIIDTSMGQIEVELFADKAPLSTKNFLDYVEKGHYNGTIFHRVIENFMIQGGGFNKEMVQKPTAPPIKNEATNGLTNDKYTLAMARTSIVDSATAQFFINVKDNSFLNNSGTTPQSYGYAVFGKVVSGQDVVDKIKAVPTGTKAGMQDVPNSIVEIKSAKKK